MRRPVLTHTASDGTVCVLIQLIEYTYQIDAALIPMVKRLFKYTPWRAVNMLKKRAYSYSKRLEKEIVMDLDQKGVTLVIQTTAPKNLLPEVMDKIKLCVEKGNTNGYDTVTGPDKKSFFIHFHYEPFPINHSHHVDFI